MYEDRVLAYIDILGFSEAIDKTIKKNEENTDETEKVDKLLEIVKEHFKYDTVLIKSKKINYFSDTIIISYKKIEEAGIFYILSDILFLCLTILTKGFLLRGAIACDKLYHEDQKIFGPALVKAYNMEKNLAIYPRIILDENIFNIAKTYPSRDNPRDFYKAIKNLTAKDFDGLYYIDYIDIKKTEIFEDDKSFSIYTEALKNIIKTTKATKDIRIKSKYLWLKEKYNTLLVKPNNNNT